jgi:hypothetical protein
MPTTHPPRFLRVVQALALAGGTTAAGCMNGGPPYCACYLDAAVGADGAVADVPVSHDGGCSTAEQSAGCATRMQNAAGPLPPPELAA